VLDDLLNHDDLHVGPYGVEAPPHWDFVVTVSEVTVVVQSGNATGQREEARTREELEERLRMADYEGRRD
jgi:hypothetical protein